MNDNIRNTGYDFTAGLERAWENTVAWLPNFLAFLVILVVGYLVAAILGKAVDRILEKVKWSSGAESSRRSASPATT